MLARGSGPLKLFASPWSAPAWIKSNKALTGQGYLLPEYYQAWANYFVKILKEYEAFIASFAIFSFSLDNYRLRLPTNKSILLKYDTT